MRAERPRCPFEPVVVCLHRHQSCDLNLNSDPCRHVRCYNSLAPHFTTLEGISETQTVFVAENLWQNESDYPERRGRYSFRLFSHFLILSSPRLPSFLSPPFRVALTPRSNLLSAPFHAQISIPLSLLLLSFLSLSLRPPPPSPNP